MMIEQSLRDAASAWIEQDPDEQTRTDLTQLLERAHTDARATSDLIEAFRAPLEFGTAGLRGQLGAGPNRMNRVTVLQAAAGLAAYLIEQGHVGEQVVIGFDARHKSDVFAHDTAAVLAGAGLMPVLFDHVVPTPVLAYAIRKLPACAGVMVTASHNPASDNGYKVYLGDGRQIVSPVDAQISSHIRAVVDVRDLELVEGWQSVSELMLDDYISSVARIVHDGPTSSEQRQEVVAVYTALHGVGWVTLDAVVKEAGFKPLHSVLAQQEPDPDFPTVPFPNPEEDGALDLAMDQAAELGADVLLANDPDADRLAVALSNASGEWTMLRGDQVGLLLAWWMSERARRCGCELTGTYASSIVSSLMLKPLAESCNVGFASTLTGFKWVSRVPNLVFGYEEALGYCVNPDEVGDKDGISAAAVTLEMCAALKAEGRTLWDALDELALQFGEHSTSQVSVRVTNLEQVAHAMGKLRLQPPSDMAGLPVTSIEDLAEGINDLPKTDAVIMHLGSADSDVQARVIVRPSGTEPKIKCYLEVVCQMPSLEHARRQAEQLLDQLGSAALPLLTGKDSE
jgi:phosphomannomutase